MDAIGGAAYQRVAEAIREHIRSGVLETGDKLPGNRDLAEQHGVALATAQKAVRLLQDEGWVATTPAVGVFVSGIPDESASVEAQLRDLRATVADLAARLERIEGGAS
ncbi:GntR family transcriptional regulator [Amycolatopsis sp. NPDC004368]